MKNRKYTDYKLLQPGRKMCYGEPLKWFNLVEFDLNLWPLTLIAIFVFLDKKILQLGKYLQDCDAVLFYFILFYLFNVS